MFLDQIGEPVNHRAALRSRHFPSPCARFEGRPRRNHSPVDVHRVRFRHLRNHFSRRWIDCRERLPRSAVHPLSINQQFVRADFHTWFNCCRCCCHEILPLRNIAARSVTTEIVPTTATKSNCSPPVGGLGSPLARVNGRQGGTPPTL